MWFNETLASPVSIITMRGESITVKAVSYFWPWPSLRAL